VSPFFYNHASPILFLLYPLYLTYPGIPALMTIQTALATLPTIPLYKLGLRLFGDRRYALLTALAYLLFPWVTTYLAGPFEVVILTAPFFALALYSLYMGNRLGYWLSLTLMMTTIEFSPILGFFIGLYILATKFDWLKAKGRVALGLETLAYSLAWFFGDFLMVYYFSHGSINIFGNVWGSALSGPLISITDSIGNAIFHFTTHTSSSSSSSHQAALSLSSVLESLANNVKTGLHTKIQSTVFLMLPTLFMNLVEPQNLLLLPWLYVMWQTTFSPYYNIWIYYTALVAPAVIVPAIWALRRFRPRVRRALLVTVFIAITISTLLFNVLSPLLASQGHLSNLLQPATTPYDLALIQLNDYVPPNESVSVPATAVPWFSLTRYGWGEHGVFFFGPYNYAKYEAYSPLAPTGYPYGLNINNYLPYIFNDGAWLLVGPFQRPYGLNYTTTITLSPLTPGQHQYSVTTIPGGGPVTVSLNVSYTPLQAIEYLTRNLSWVLQQPQSGVCGTLPGYFELLNSIDYIVQPIIINETTKLEALTVFGSGSSSLVSGQVAISRSPVPINRSGYLWSAGFEEPWWCKPHSWATPISVKPNLTLKPGTYYVIVNMPTNPWQVVCTYIPGAPKALLYNGTGLQQLNCTMNLIMLTNRPAEVANANASVSISLIMQNSTAVALNKTVTLFAQRPFELPLTYQANLTGSSYQEALLVNVNQSSGLPLPGELSVTISDYAPADSPPIPLIKLHSLNYTAVETLMPIIPYPHQYPLALLPEGPVNVSLSVYYTPLQGLEYLTSDLPWVLQLPQGVTCGTLPGYFALMNSSEYLVQQVTINETALIKALTVFGSGSSNLVHGEVMISSSEVPTLKHDVLWSTGFWEPWWCSPHGWATPITVNPMITLRPGTYYVILNMPTNPWQALCTYIPGAPKALLYNGTGLRQLNCTVNLIMLTNRSSILTNVSSNITVSLLGRTITISPQRPAQKALTFEANVTQRAAWETLVVNASEAIPGNLTIRVNTYVPGKYPPIRVPWYLIPAYGNIPTYALLALAIAFLAARERRVAG
jgi:uncharacterized membrane protein